MKTSLLLFLRSGHSSVRVVWVALLPASSDAAVVTICGRQAAAPEENPEEAAGAEAALSPSGGGTRQEAGWRRSVCQSHPSVTSADHWHCGRRRPEPRHSEEALPVSVWPWDGLKVERSTYILTKSHSCSSNDVKLDNNYKNKKKKNENDLWFVVTLTLTTMICHLCFVTRNRWHSESMTHFKVLITDKYVKCENVHICKYFQIIWE